MSMEDLLELYAQVYFDSSRAMTEYRISVMTYYFIGVTTVFGFWLTLENEDRRRRLTKGLIMLIGAASAYAAFIVFVVNQDIAVTWTTGEKTIRQLHDSLGGEATSRDFFAKKYSEAGQQFWEVYALHRFLIYSLPILIYGAALSVTCAIHGRRG